MGGECGSVRVPGCGRPSGDRPKPVRPGAHVDILRRSAEDLGDVLLGLPIRCDSGGLPFADTLFVHAGPQTSPSSCRTDLPGRGQRQSCPRGSDQHQGVGVLSHSVIQSAASAPSVAGKWPGLPPGLPTTAVATCPVDRHSITSATWRAVRMYQRSERPFSSLRTTSPEQCHAGTSKTVPRATRPSSSCGHRPSGRTFERRSTCTLPRPG